jgi:hypothetical protein
MDAEYRSMIGLNGKPYVRFRTELFLGQFQIGPLGIETGHDRKGGAGRMRPLALGTVPPPPY